MASGSNGGTGGGSSIKGSTKAKARGFTVRSVYNPAIAPF